MPVFGPVKRVELVRFLKRLGFEGPFAGGRHQFMVRGDITIRLPNPHQADVSRGLLSRILRHARISRDEWEQL